MDFLIFYMGHFDNVAKNKDYFYIHIKDSSFFWSNERYIQNNFLQMVTATKF